MAAPRLPVVLLPGLDGTGDLFEPFAAHAPPHLQPMIVRLPPLGDYSEGDVDVGLRRRRRAARRQPFCPFVDAAGVLWETSGA